MLPKFRMAVLFSLVVCGFMPADENQEEPKPSGFFGTLTAGGYHASGKSSQSDADDDNRRIESLVRNDRRTSETGPGFLGTLGYRFAKTGTEISLGSSIENDGVLTLEAAQSFKRIGLMKWSLQAGRGEVWRDPYLTGRDREKTDEDLHGFGFRWEKIFQTGAWLEARGNHIEIEEDEIGRRHPDLRRDGDLGAFEAGYEFKLGEGHFLTPWGGLYHAETDGEANRMDGYGLGVKHVLSAGKFMLETKLAYGRSGYGKQHPFFGHKREDDEYSLFSTLTWLQPFGFRNYFAVLSGGHFRTRSNIDFYERTRYLTLLGVGYSF